MTAATPARCVACGGVLVRDEGSQSQVECLACRRVFATGEVMG